MTENKRFIGSSGGVYDQYKEDRFAWSEWEDIIQIMNNLNEKARERSKALSKLQKENEGLKCRIKKLQIELDNYSEIFNELNALIDENEQLQRKNDNLVNMIARVQYRADLIKEENEQLKQDIEHCANQFKDDGKNVLLGLK